MKINLQKKPIRRVATINIIPVCGQLRKSSVNLSK